jgi:hypothetical protein
MADGAAKSGNYASAILFTVLVFISCALTFIFLTALHQNPWALIMSITTLIFGNISFTRFETALAPPPPLQEFHDPDTFVSKLKNGSEITFVIQILFVAETPSPSALEQIKYRILRRLNETIPSLDALYEHPLPVTDRLVQQDVPDLCRELKLKSLTLRTIEVSGGNAQTTHHSPGIFFGNGPA